MENRSAELNELFGALAKAQAEMNTASLSNENPYFKSRYADLGEFIRATRPALTKHGLAVIQQITPTEDNVHILHTILAHSSGQWVESQMRITPPKNDIKNDIQTMGSYITYLRRYTYAAIVGVVASEEDDDGQHAVQSHREVAKQPQKPIGFIVPEQLEELEHELNGYGDVKQMVLDGLRIKDLSQMPKDKFLPSIKRIREIKQAREGK